MIGLASKLALPLLLRLDPETAHGLSIKALKLGLPKVAPPKPDKRLAVKVAGLNFPNPLGLAAGYDKNGEVPDALLGLGFGFVEVGSITPRPQAGNPQPRIFRLPRDGAVINRLGFNNGGHDACHGRLAGRVGRPGIVGINIGANKDSTDRAADYELGVRRFAAIASYLTINVSSPNTPGLRNMQARAELGELLTRVVAARRALPAGGGRATPIFLKIAPDLTDGEMEDIAEAVLARPIEGLIVSNTTIARPTLSDKEVAAETGGLSGRPLFARSTMVLARMRKLVGPDIAIIGAGGVSTAETALEKIRAGADLVQLYTGMIYGGPALPSRILGGLSRLLDAEKAPSLHALRGSKTDFWADAAP